MKKDIKTVVLLVGGVVAILGLIVWSSEMQKNNPNTLSMHGIHWHPQVHIFVDGDEQKLPANIGLEHGHSPMHTHDEDSGEHVVHLEFTGKVAKKDVVLKNFFKTWNKEMSDFGNLDHMTVNGKDNTDFGNYMMQDEDIINMYYVTQKEDE